MTCKTNLLWQEFQSTRPSRASTHLFQMIFQYCTISIHKALAGLDLLLSAQRTPVATFQSTRPSRASTLNSISVIHVPVGISIHKALAGLDRLLKRQQLMQLNFNPQGPRGPRRFWTAVSSGPHDFNPQGPRGPRPRWIYVSMCYQCISIHKALAGLDQFPFPVYSVIIQFQSTRPSRASTTCSNNGRLTL